jgi:hypothetical protein
VTEPDVDQKAKEADLAFKRLNYAVQLLQNEVGRVWQRSLAFWGFVAAAFVAYGVFIDKHSVLALVIASFGLICSVCWTLINRASRWSQNSWVTKVDALELAALGTKILKPTPAMTEHRKCLDRLWDGERYSTTRLMIALSDATSIVWVLLVIKSSVPFLQTRPSEWPVAVIAILLGTFSYIVAVALLTRSPSNEPSPLDQA